MGTAAASSCCMVIADSEETCPDPLVQSEASVVGTHEHNGVPYMSCCEDPTVMAANDWCEDSDGPNQEIDPNAGTAIISSSTTEESGSMTMEESHSETSTSESTTKTETTSTTETDNAAGKMTASALAAAVVVGVGIAL